LILHSEKNQNGVFNLDVIKDERIIPHKPGILSGHTIERTPVSGRLDTDNLPMSDDEDSILTKEELEAQKRHKMYNAEFAKYCEERRRKRILTNIN
jgi:hypothetical protein